MNKKEKEAINSKIDKLLDGLSREEEQALVDRMRNVFASEMKEEVIALQAMMEAQKAFEDCIEEAGFDPSYWRLDTRVYTLDEIFQKRKEIRVIEFDEYQGDEKHGRTK
jgi:hypothetical protein